MLTANELRRQNHNIDTLRADGKSNPQKLLGLLLWSW